MMHLESLPIPGAHLVAATNHADERGSFGRLFDAAFLEGLGCGERLHQVNLSRTRVKGCVRGMHLQVAPKSGFKLVACLRGSIWDVCLDVRAGSVTEGRWEGRELTGGRGELLLVPPGCAHGFQALTDDVEMIYLMAEEFDPASERRIQPLDPGLAIAWPQPVSMLSPADASAPTYNPTSFRAIP